MLAAIDAGRLALIWVPSWLAACAPSWPGSSLNFCLQQACSQQNSGEGAAEGLWEQIASPGVKLDNDLVEVRGKSMAPGQKGRSMEAWIVMELCSRGCLQVRPLGL